MQWWEHSPPTNMAQVQILASTPYVDWVCCWFSPLLWEVFLQVLRFSPLLKNQDFQIPIWSEMHVHISRSSLGTPTVVSSLWVQNYKFYNNNKKLQPWNAQLYYMHHHYYTSTTSVCFGVSRLMAKMETDCNIAIIQHLSFSFLSTRKDGSEYLVIIWAQLWPKTCQTHHDIHVLNPFNDNH